MSNAEIPLNAPNDTAYDDAMDVPALLRRAREQRGEEIAEVAGILRIRRTYLEAIEAGDFNSLPGNAYTLGFIRSYSEHLGLDGEEILRRFKAQPQGVEAKSDLSFPTFVPQHGIPGMAVILIGLIIAGGGYGVWYFMTEGDRFQTELVQPVPSSIATLPAQNETQIETQNETQNETTTSGNVPAKPDDSTAQPSSQIDPSPVTAGPRGEGEPAVVTEAVEAAAPKATAPTTEPTPSAEAPAHSENTPVVDRSATTATHADDNPSAPVPARQEPTAAITPPEPSPEPAAVSTVAAIPGPPGPPAQAPEAAQPNPGQAALNDVGSSRIPAAPETSVAVAVPPKTPTETPAKTPSPSAEVTNIGANTRIVVNAKADSWIQIRDDKADRLIMTRLLRRGESYDVPARPGLTLLTGNAGGLEITVDGKSIPALGPIGAVRRHVALDAEKLQNGTAVLE